MNKSILIDFDGTIVDHAFPEIGEPKPHAFEVMKELKEAGYKLILWTCRENKPTQVENFWSDHLQEAIDFCKDNGVEFDAVNETYWPLDYRDGAGVPARKPHVHCVIDDKNLGGFPGWPAVRKELLSD